MLEMTAKRRWMLLATVSAGLLLITLDNSILYTTLPTLTEELGASGTQSLWVINAYPLVMAGLLLGAGTLGDRIGHRRMFMIGLVVFGLASVMAAFSPTVEVLIAARAILAVGAAAMMPATLSLIRIGFEDERERNIAIAIWGSLSVVGNALGPIVAGVLLEFFWWGSVFLINVPVVIAALIATVVVAPRNQGDATKHWDFISSLQVMVGLVGAVFAIKELAQTPPNWGIVAVAAIASLIGFVLFVRRQRKLPHPLLDFSIFRIPAFTAGVLAAAFAMFALAGIQLVTTQRFQIVEGFTPLQAGLLVAAIGVGCLPTSILSGAVLHRAGLLPLIGGGLVISVAGTVVAVFGAVNSFGVFLTGLFVIGAGIGLALGVASTAIIGNVPARRAGMAASVEEVSYEFGNLIAVTLMGTILAFSYSAAFIAPTGAPSEAGESIADALRVAGEDPNTLDAAFAAFDQAYLTVLIVIAGILAAGTLLIGWLLRHHGPGSQSQLTADEAYETATETSPEN